MCKTNVKENKKLYFFFVAWQSQKNWMCKNELLDLDNKSKPDETEFPVFYCNKWHLRKHWKNKSKGNKWNPIEKQEIR